MSWYRFIYDFRIARVCLHHGDLWLLSFLVSFINPQDVRVIAANLWQLQLEVGYLKNYRQKYLIAPSSDSNEQTEKEDK